MRPLSEITALEGAALWDAVMPEKYTPFRGDCYKRPDYKELPARAVFYQGVERMGIYFTGKVWADSDLEPLQLDQEKVKQFLNGIGIEYNLPNETKQ